MPSFSFFATNISCLTINQTFCKEILYSFAEHEIIINVYQSRKRKKIQHIFDEGKEKSKKVRLSQKQVVEEALFKVVYTATEKLHISNWSFSASKGKFFADKFGQPSLILAWV